MIIASLDVGIYNLSYNIIQILETEDPSGNPTKTVKILKWDCIETIDRPSMKKDKESVLINLPLVLDKIEDFHNCDVVLIENQPCMKNPIMKKIQSHLHAYFIINGFHNKDSKIGIIKPINASNKLKVYDGPELDIKQCKSSYTMRKKYAVEHCKYFLDMYGEAKFKEHYMKQKKKDDYADCYLQALYYYNTAVLGKKLTKKRVKKTKV
jgi:hypothetical protein